MVTPPGPSPTSRLPATYLTPACLNLFVFSTSLFFRYVAEVKRIFDTYKHLNPDYKNKDLTVVP